MNPNDSPFSLTGKGVAVTGGGGHLGRSIALTLAQAGATVVIQGRRPELLQLVATEAASQGLEGMIIACPGDSGIVEDIRKAIVAAESRVGKIDGWVNNAFEGSSRPLLGSLSVEAVQTAVRGTLSKQMLATDIVGSRMSATGGGSISKYRVDVWSGFSKSRTLLP